MKTSGKTIQIYLPDGSPTSIRVAEITSRIVSATLVPRNKLQEADKRKELKNVGSYFLFGETEESENPQVYIGESEDCYSRLKEHNRKKEFWQSAVVIVSKTEHFTRTQAKYLEWHFIEETRSINRFSIKNTVNPLKPSITEPLEADLMDNFDTIKILLSALGFPIFDEISKKKDGLMICNGRGARAEGMLTDKGFTVFKNSSAALNETNGAAGWVKNLRIRLISEGKMKRHGELLVLNEDLDFKTPTGGAAVILGRHANGWIEWKNKKGKTLDELYRK